MSYQITLSPAAQRDLKKLPPQIRRAVFNQHLSQIAVAPQAAGEPLHGNLKGLLSYHFGHRPQYRILYSVEKSRMVLVVFVGTRENAYEEAYEQEGRRVR